VDRTHIVEGVRSCISASGASEMCADYLHHYVKQAEEKIAKLTKERDELHVLWFRKERADG
jgi:hypothetical protein